MKAKYRDQMLRSFLRSFFRSFPLLRPFFSPPSSYHRLWHRSRLTVYVARPLVRLSVTSRRRKAAGEAAAACLCLLACLLATKRAKERSCENFHDRVIPNDLVRGPQLQRSRLTPATTAVTICLAILSIVCGCVARWRMMSMLERGMSPLIRCCCCCLEHCKCH